MAIDRALRQYRAGLVLIDAGAIGLGLIAATTVRHHGVFPDAYLVALPYTVLVTLFALRKFGAYGGAMPRNTLREATQIGFGLAAGIVGALALSFFYRGFSFSRLSVTIFLPLAFVLILTFRLVYRVALDRLLGRSRWLKRTIIVGSSRQAEDVAGHVLQYQGEYAILGRVERRVAAEQGPDSGPVGSLATLGALDELEEVIDATRPDLVILADPSVDDEGYRRVIQACYDRNIHWKVVPRVPTPPNQDIALTVIGGVPLLGSRGNNITGINFLVKRAVDIAVAGLLLLVFAPLMALVALLIRAFSPGPVLFRQQRIGYRGQAFDFFKFRSMHLSNDDSIHREYVKRYISGDGTTAQSDGGVRVHKITRDPRIIPYVGAFIRKYSIDELPQLFNVIRGDMSLVGPRPCLSYEVEQYRRWHKMRFDVLPGITGLWQVSGRNRLTFDEMVRLDIRYLQNWSLALDLLIILRTPYTVLFDKAY